MKTETWYLLEDGNVADPRKCVPDKSGHLTCEGVRVKMRGDVYHSRSVDLDNLPVKTKAKLPEPEAKEVKPEEPKPVYKTRESKAK